MEEGIVRKKGGKDKEGVADDWGDNGDEDWRNKQGVDDGAVEKWGCKAGTFSEIEIDLFVIHAYYWINSSITRMIYKV